MLKIFLKSPIYYHVTIYNKLRDYVEDDFYKVFYWSKVGITPYNDKEMPDLKRVWLTEEELKHNHSFLPSIKLGRWDGGFLPRLSIRTWIEILKSSDRDVLFLQGYSNLDEIVCLILSKFVQCKVMFRGEGDPKPRENKVKVLFKKFLLKHLDVIFYSTLSNKVYYESYKSDKSELFYYPSISVMTRSPLSYSERKNNVVVASRLTDRKRVDIAIKIFHYCFPNDWTLTVLGDGDESIVKDLKQLASKLGVSDRVAFLGFLPQERVTEIFCESKFYLNTSSYDPSPKALNEALEAQCRVVLSDKVGTSSTVSCLNGVFVANLESSKYDDVSTFVKNELFNERNPERKLPTSEDCIRGLLDAYRKII